jgi:SAM-dependent methyltransferase
VRHPQLPGLDIDEGWAVLEVGSGPSRLLPTSTTLDIFAGCQPDIVHDLNVTPYPIPDHAYDLVVCMHVLEHVRDLVGATTELHRVLKPGGLLFVEAPYFSSPHSYADPTHVHAFTTRSFDYYVEGTPLSRFGYSPARFEKERVDIVVPQRGVLTRWLHRWINAHQRTYEERLAFLLPRHSIRFTLRAVAPGRPVPAPAANAISRRTPWAGAPASPSGPRGA